MNKKIFLIIIALLAYAGAGISTATFAKSGLLTVEMQLSFVALLVLNICCTCFLYSKAKKDKLEWAIFGSIANLTALLCFWVFNRKTIKP